MRSRSARSPLTLASPALAAAWLVLGFAAAARADFYWAVAAGERRFTAREDRDYRAERSALTPCIEAFSPLLCELVELRQGERGWEAIVIGRKGFYAVDGDRQDRAERRALASCEADASLVNCRIEQQTRSGRSDAGRSGADGRQGQDQGQRPPRLEDLFKR